MSAIVEASQISTPLEAPGSANGTVAIEQGPKPQERVPRPKRPNYVQIHSRPLPLNIYPLPTFIPHNPLSLLRIAYALFSQFFWPPSSHPPDSYKGYFSHETQSVHVTDVKTIRALWERGFFGKGNLSRSEPRWLDQEKRKRGLLVLETSEEVTRQRREDRRQFKLERARKEREAIEQQLREEGKLGDLAPVNETLGTEAVVESEQNPLPFSNGNANNHSELNSFTSGSMDVNPLENDSNEADRTPWAPEATISSNEVAIDGLDEVLEDEEHLQLTCEESFFLVYGLGVLEVSDQGTAIQTSALFKLFCQNSSFPSRRASTFEPDNPFLLKYVVYHHFRSLGWVVRPGVKFAVDYLLYNRGPVFSHAEFAIIILPSYSHPYWSESSERKLQTAKKETKDWWWLHRVNRVQTQVHKSLVLVYVDIPPPSHGTPEDRGFNIGNILKRYKVREFVLRRWIPNRNRD
ncbi:hypothetical protein K432DRAFT_29535 [Lepidopterella palustris CBS 459.81]|uniref:tRNA-splicing endonuclease subunit Sen2 n=1 Tax=Lepidopterella palustris CBS 459.81 TaxID=1314670 RepID=A0A8E2EBK2_9PEZI|nr:hypothetical protein K432DRAFT_29535 [Lepidopterella palustris CBS 459.81]